MYKKFLLYVYIIFMLLIISACNNRDPFDSVVSGDFVYTRWSMAEGEIAIIGLSDEGINKETLIFPSTLDGYRVTQIGDKFGLKDSGTLFIEKALNIYFTSSITHVVTSIDYKNIDTIAEINVFVGGSSIESRLYAWTYPYSNINVYLSAYEYSNVIDDEIVYGRFVCSNVEYYLDNEHVYFVDHAEGKTVNTIPPIPSKAGYVFDGWYKDESLNQPWNFDEDTIPNKEFDEQNSVINITKIYAKWK